MERLLLCCLVSSATGCGAPRTAESSRASAPVTGSATARAVAPRAPPDARSAIAPAAPAKASAAVRVEALAPSPERESVPRVEIVEPAFGDRLAPLAIREQQVKLRVTGAATGDRVLVSLDGRRPRSRDRTSLLRLAELLPEDQAIDAGAHVLLAVAVDAGGAPLRARGAAVAPFSVVDFVVGDAPRGDLPAEGPRVFCLAPAGTFHGAEADRLVLSLFAVGAPGGKLPLSIAGPGVDLATEVDPAISYAVSGLPSGDFRFAVQASRQSRAECVATVNRELRQP